MKVLPGNFYSFPHIANTTMTTKDINELLLATEGWSLIMGRMWEIKTKHLGADVYRVWLERKKYN